jgi:type I restriction enzyme R subunit
MTPAIKHFFKAHITDRLIPDIIDTHAYTELATNPVFSTRDHKAVPAAFRAIVSEYVRDYVSLNQVAQ